MSDWQRLSVREGRREPLGLREDFSEAATNSLVHWLEGEFGYRTAGPTDRFDQLVMNVALICDIPLNYDARYEASLMHQLVGQAELDDDLMLDVLDATLARGGRMAVNQLRTVLFDAGSAWTVRDDGTGLTRRVDPMATEAFRAVVRPADAASAELSEAWSRLYGRTIDYSDAWDHAIKAMEDVLVPIVAPANPRATLGVVVTELRKGVRHVRFSLGTTEVLGEIVKMAWPNPDRHGGSDKRTPTAEEAAGVVHLAISVVQWARDGLVTQTEQ